jgi:hypothetical protein
MTGVFQWAVFVAKQFAMASKATDNPRRTIRRPKLTRA